MKKLGFTLAEILIALAIVGVVAAISLPTLSLNTKKQAHEASLKVATSDLENAFASLIVSEGLDVLSETDAWQEDDYGFIDILGKYIKISKTSTLDSIEFGTTAFETKNGFLYSFYREGTPDSDGNVAKIYIDVNGDKKPNKKDVDQFEFKLSDTGFLEKMDTEETTSGEEPEV